MPYHAKKYDRWVLKKFRGRLQKTSCNIFCNCYKQICINKSPQNIELFKCTALNYECCYKQATNCTLKVTVESWECPKDVHMRRPATYFATVLNWLTSTDLTKTLNLIKHRLFCITQAALCVIKVINESWKHSQGRPYKTSCNIFWKRFKQIDVYKFPRNIELYTI